ALLIPERDDRLGLLFRAERSQEVIGCLSHDRDRVHVMVHIVRRGLPVTLLAGDQAASQQVSRRTEKRTSLNLAHESPPNRRARPASAHRVIPFNQMIVRNSAWRPEHRADAGADKTAVVE